MRHRNLTAGPAGGLAMIPRTIDDITPEWLSHAFGRDVRALRSEPVGVGVGLVGNLFRLQLDTEDSNDLPATIIAKLAAPTDEGRFVATVLNMYGRELGFYRELSSQTPIAHPACYYGDHDPATQDAVLLLEDVSSRGRCIDQIAGCSPAQTGPALRTLARLHARFWDSPDLDRVPWLLRLCDDPYPGAVAFAYDTAWPRVLEMLPDVIRPDLREFGAEYAAHIPALFARLSEGPLVLSHADWRVDNLFFTPQGDVVAVDWQLVDRSVGPRDLSYFVTQSVNVSSAGDYEAAFDAYVGELRVLGVGVDRAWAWEMYRYGAMLGWAYPVIAVGALTIDDPRHVELGRTITARAIAALDALDVRSLPL